MTFNFIADPMRTRFIITIIFIALSIFSVSAQNYDSAVGLRLGAPLSLSYKKIINENKALEGYIGTRGKSGYRYVNITGAYNIIQPIDIASIEELYYYYGAGVSIYTWSYEEDGPNQNVTPGIQGQLGLEYTFSDRPINLTLEWTPTIFLSSEFTTFKPYLSIGVRYVLTRESNNGNLNTQ